MNTTKTTRQFQAESSRARRVASRRSWTTPCRARQRGLLARLAFGCLAASLPALLPSSAAAQFVAPAPSYPAQPPPGGYGPSAYPSQPAPDGYAPGGYPATTGQAAAPTAPQAVRVPIFAHVLGGAWIPWPGAFAENHRPGGALDVMVGFSLEPFVRQRLDLFVDIAVSRHDLQDRAIVDEATQTTITSATIGGRYFLTGLSSGSGPYILAAAGLVYEAAERNAVHAPPHPSWITMAGLGWELPLGSVLRLGARVTATYLNEGSQALGWVAPSLTLGAQI